MIGDRAIEDAARRIAGWVRRTPVSEVEVDGVAVTLKLELLQHTGSFKPRGAFNRILGEGDLGQRGVIAASGGNHGLAVAFVASKLGIPAEIFVPEVTPKIKRDRIAALGARLVVGGALYQDSLEASSIRAAETGSLEIHAYDHPATVAGQGTMTREITEQVPELGSLLVAVGGGGLIGGAAAWLAGTRKLVAVEPEGSAACARALEAGHPVDVEVDSIAADSLGSRSIGAIPFAEIARGVTASVLVSDEAIRRAQRWLWDEMRLIAEPGGATALAAILSQEYVPEPGERCVVVVCGANTDPAAITG